MSVEEVWVKCKLLPLFTHFSLHFDSSPISVPADQENSCNVFQTFFQVFKATNESGACMRYCLNDLEISFFFKRTGQTTCHNRVLQCDSVVVHARRTSS